MSSCCMSVARILYLSNSLVYIDYTVMVRKNCHKYCKLCNVMDISGQIVENAKFQIQEYYLSLVSLVY